MNTIKKAFTPTALVVKTNKFGSTLVNLATGERKDYKGEAPNGALFHRKNIFTGLKPAGEEGSIGDLRSLQVLRYPSFTASEEAAALALAQGGGRDTYSATRRDLRHLPTFTIDGAESKDLDDAISVVPDGKGYRVWVSIADVTAWIPKNSKLDRAARKRLTTQYWPGYSLPMFPRPLTEGKFSLNPGEDRTVLTTEYLLVDGEVQEFKIYPALINSDWRLVYGDVTEFLLGNPTAIPVEAQASINHAAAAVDLDLTYSEESREYKFEVEGDIQVVGYTSLVTGPANKLVEHYMVQTNHLKGRFLAEEVGVGAYRVHKLRDPEKVEKALAKVNSLFPLPEDATYDEALALVEASDHERKEVLLKFLLWTTPPAEYKNVAEGHEGLGLSVYAHGTSPIRRYADMVVHRLIHAKLVDAKLPYKGASLDKLLAKINEATFQAKRQARFMDDVYLNSHLARELAQGSYRGKQVAKVEGFSKGGAFCSFGHGKDGFLYLDQLGPGELNEEMTIFTGKYRTVIVGDTVPVTVGRPDLSRGRLNLRFYRDKNRGGNRRDRKPKASAGTAS